MMTISNNCHDHMPLDIIPVIASFDSKGNIKPLYVRIEGESCKVHSYWVQNEFNTHLVFHCELENQNHLIPVVITYIILERLWTVPKKNKTR